HPRDAVEVLAANTAARDHAFWADQVPFARAVAFAGERLVGHQQVTDAYLLGLAIHYGGRLATLDPRIAELPAPQSAERETLEVIT
ncbi:MAG: VapC toxin family PIN domain ribonuclease, partial [Verrucomicrobiae bacterium]|nr:VapC toxin family PIN domain ribonuclease [Verrucomicrobiae bacterium]